MRIGEITISFPRQGIVRFTLSMANGKPSPFDYLDTDRVNAARMIRILRRTETADDVHQLTEKN